MTCFFITKAVVLGGKLICELDSSLSAGILEIGWVETILGDGLTFRVYVGAGSGTRRVTVWCGGVVRFGAFVTVLVDPLFSVVNHPLSFTSLLLKF